MPGNCNNCFIDGSVEKVLENLLADVEGKSEERGSFAGGHVFCAAKSLEDAL